MIKNLYPRYFQKSRSFIFPFLEIPKLSQYVPYESYVAWKNVYVPQDQKLILTYEAVDKTTVARWKYFEYHSLLRNRYFAEAFPIDDSGMTAYVFDMSYFASDFNSFLAGRYSTYTPKAKELIGKYFGITTPEWAYLETFLNPKKYFQHYAHLLDVPEDDLNQVGELINPYDPEKEVLRAKKVESVLYNAQSIL